MPDFWVGLGYRQGTARSTIELAVQEVCQAHHLALTSIAGIATIEVKATESGLLDLCRDRGWKLRLFSAEALRSVAVPTPAAAVDRQVGTPSVAEACALLASAAHKLCVPKQILRFPDRSEAVTIAIAQVDREAER
jgi:cobalt-precorrin 5A hydrolase / precorrin-3B C17-methyltransferase